MVKSWLRTHQKRVVVHSLILGGFLLYLIFLADPLFDRFIAIPGESTPQQLSLPRKTDNIYYWIDLFSVGTRHIEVMGWAFIEGQSSENASVYLILKSQDNTYAFKVISQLKPSITEVYKELGLNLDWSGFHCIIPLRKISQGEYNVGLYVTIGDIEALQYTDRVVVK